MNARHGQVEDWIRFVGTRSASTKEDMSVKTSAAFHFFVKDILPVILEMNAEINIRNWRRRREREEERILLKAFDQSRVAERVTQKNKKTIIRKILRSESIFCNKNIVAMIHAGDTCEVHSNLMP